MKKMFLLLMVLLLIMAQSALADMRTYPLNCAGTYDENSGAWIHNFDLGVAFTEITQVSIQWSGKMEAATVSLPNPPRSEYWDAIILASLFFDSGYASAKAEAGAVEYPDTEEFDCDSVFTGLSADEAADLLDGTGQIQIEYEELVLLEGSYAIHGEVLLNDAVLVVDGVIVPEPICATLLLIGATALLRKR